MDAAATPPQKHSKTTLYEQRISSLIKTKKGMCAQIECRGHHPASVSVSRLYTSNKMIPTVNTLFSFLFRKLVCKESTIH